MAMDNLDRLMAFARGDLSESALGDYDDGPELDDEVVQECAEFALPLILEAEILGNTGEAITEAVEKAYRKLGSYFVGQGVLDEAATIALPKNPKVNIVRFNRQAVLSRLKTQYVLTLARRDNDRHFKKFKLACALKKQNKEAMFKKYGARAEKLAKRHYQATKGGKVKAVVSDAKSSVKAKSK